MERRQKIALFLGSDIVAQLIMNKVVPIMLHLGYEPVLFFPEYKPIVHPADKGLSPDDPKYQEHLQRYLSVNLPEMKDYAYIERLIFEDKINAYLRAHAGAESQVNFTPAQLGMKYGLQVENVDNVNDPAFIQRLAEMPGLELALSIRCFQIFGATFIERLQKRGVWLLNLHPGILPKFRGVYSTAWAMATGSPFIGCTLHHIDTGIDTGDVISVDSRPVSWNRSVYLNNFLSMPLLAAGAIEQLLLRIKRGDGLLGTPHKPNKEDYHSYPTEDQLNAWKAKPGFTLYDFNEVPGLLTSAFYKASTPEGEKLGDGLHDIIKETLDLRARMKPANDSNSSPVPSTKFRICG